MLFVEPKKQNTYSNGTGRRMRGETTAGDKGTLFILVFPFCATHTNAGTTISTICTQISSFKAGERLTPVASAIGASSCGAGDASCTERVRGTANRSNRREKSYTAAGMRG